MQIGKKFSICIPTYNRASYLDLCIQSIVNQLTPETKSLIEITVSDNASDDNTEEIVNKYKDFVDIVYHRNEKNMGADYNYLKCAELSSGEYAMIMGSDDELAEGGIAYILNEIKSGYEIYLSDRIECDIEMQNPKIRHFTNYPLTKRLFDFKDNKDLIEYFSQVNTLGGVFSYLTSIIFKKSAWNNVVFDEKYIGTLYSHIFYLLSFIKQDQCRFYYLEKPIAKCRLGNDGFLDKQYLLRRKNIDFKGYYMLAKDFFPERNVYHEFLNIMTREHDIGSLRYTFLNCPMTIEDWDSFKKYFKYYPYKIEKKLFILFFPNIYKFYLIKKQRKEIIRRPRLFAEIINKNYFNEIKE